MVVLKANMRPNQIRGSSQPALAHELLTLREGLSTGYPQVRQSSKGEKEGNPRTLDENFSWRGELFLFRNSRAQPKCHNPVLPRASSQTAG
jgi:hypothetical protein